MNRSKVKLTAVCVAAAVVFVGACLDNGRGEFVISDSKRYEASLFRQNCSICHGPEAKGKTLDDGRQIPSLRDGEYKFNSDAEIYRHISEGGNGMTPFAGQLTDREIRLLTEFVQRELRGRK